MFILVSIFAIFFALNMGGSSFAAAFSPSVGGGMISQRKAGLFFIFFLILGSVLGGAAVSETLGEDLVPSQILTQKAVLIIFLTGSLGMFSAHLMKIPQSTSLVAVASIAGVGVAHNSLNTQTVLYMVPFWIVLPVVAYGITFLIGKNIYPPRDSNFWVYEKLINHENRLKAFVLFTACYNAFSVGTNNVANVAGPLMVNQDWPVTQTLFYAAIIFGLGAFLFSKTLKATSHEIVPLGQMSSSLIAFVSGTLMLIASFWGIPQSFVMLQVAAIFAIASIKDTPEMTFKSEMARKTFYTWTINPLLIFGLSFGLAKLI